MSWWFQLLMWVMLTIASLAYLGFLIYRLAIKGLGVLKVAQPAIDQLVIFSKALAPTATYQKPNDNLLDDVNVHLVERAKLKKKRELAAEQRQRRLIARIRDIDTQESELKNGRT
jgi:hypothetical protein